MEDQLSKLTGAQQTMLSWAKVIDTYELIPEAFMSSYQKFLKDEPIFPYTVFAPSIAGFHHKTTEKLLCEIRESIYVWQRIGNRVNLTVYPLRSITDLEVGCILLFSWITIGGMTQSGLVSSSTVEFNTATTRHFSRFVNKLRPAPNILNGNERWVERSKFDYLKIDCFKFMNYAIESLVGSEKVIQTIWQPKICKPIVRFGRLMFNRALALPTLTILTDKELIIIQDDERIRENRGTRYGGKWKYVALNHIKSASLVNMTDDPLLFTIELSPGGRRVDIPFAQPLRQEAVVMREKLEKLIC